MTPSRIFVSLPYTLMVLLFAASLAFVSCNEKDEPVQPLPPQKPDTTSHTFVWTIDTLGAEISRVNDLFCLSENDAWAVGMFYVKDSTGKIDQTLSCNLAHWDGNAWTLSRVNPIYQGHQTFAEMSAVFALNKNNLWADYLHWDGNKWNPYDVNIISTGSLRKIWGSERSVYFVGEHGSIMRWDGLRFVQNGYVTSAANTDVWGWNDTVYVATTDYDQQSGAPGYFVKIVNGKIVGKELIPDGEMIAVWGMDGRWYGAGCDGPSMFVKESEKWIKVSFPINRCKENIRGTALNNVFFATEERAVFHFNGSTMAEILPVDPDAALIDGLSAAGKMVLVADTKNLRAIVYRGYRQGR